jgi:MoxR-like ATPase
MEGISSASSPFGLAVANRLKDNIGKAVVGKVSTIELMLVALLCEGHVLLEDVPGVGKTLLAKALAKSLGFSFRRIQFTPDLLPSDITGSRVFNQRTAEFEFRPGPIFSQIILADEVNRATPRTQAALLEAMEERQVTADGVTMALERPFLVLATQNPIELEGTFPLPEAQLDRFQLRLDLGYPNPEEEHAILTRVANAEPLNQVERVVQPTDLQQLQSMSARVRLNEAVRGYLVEIIRTTRNWPGIVLGGSPRASLALYRSACALACLRGRTYVLPDEVKELAPVVLGHRLILNSDARIKGKTPRTLVAEVLDKVPVPVEETIEAVSAHG